MTIDQAKTFSFLQPLGQVPLHVRLAKQPGKNGVGTIAEADLDPDLLRFLQTCPSWKSLAEKHLECGATMANSINANEAALGLKTEIAGIVDEANPPKSLNLNRDKNAADPVGALRRIRASDSEKVAPLAPRAGQPNARGGPS